MTELHHEPPQQAARLPIREYLIALAVAITWPGWCAAALILTALDLLHGHGTVTELGAVLGAILLTLGLWLAAVGGSAALLLYLF